MKVLILNWRDITHNESGGAEVYVHEIGKRLVSRGFSVTLFCRGDSHGSRKKEIIDGINIVRKGNAYTVFIWSFLYWIFYFRKQKFNKIIESQNGIPFFSPLYTKNNKIVYIIHHIHKDIFFKYLNKPFAYIASWVEGWVVPKVYKECKCVAVSQSTKDEMQKLCHDERPIKIISPGIDLKVFSPGVKSPFPLIVYVGRIKTYKSLDVLVRAFSLISNSLPDARLIIGGDGDGRKELELSIKEADLGDRIDFLGKVTEKEKIDLLQKAWIFVQPSSKEGWGITVTEANACGTPVIASNVSGLCDSVKDGFNGFLFPYGDVEILSKKMSEIIKDKKMREELSKNAYEFAKKYDLDTITQSMVKLLQEKI
ncbi:MAG: glycosyltransferase family 4 protein [Candidatus Taylorbacteria bacterium]|nr:glycosyltransferase family 4 protein [Candidatus Taylorbacteria bacterium]